MLFQVSKSPTFLLKATSKAAVARSLATAVPITETGTTEKNVEEDSFAFYPIEKNRVQGTYNVPQTTSRECFSYYPSNGIAATTNVAETTETATFLDVTKPEEFNISKNLWRSVIEERLMKKTTETTSNPIAAVEGSTIDDSFAFYPVQSNRVKGTQETVGEEEEAAAARDCFSFYPSNGVKAAGSNTEGIQMIADKVPSHVKDHIQESEFFGVEKKNSFEDQTPSPTNWESTIMQALKNVTTTDTKEATTTFAVVTP